MTSCSCYRPTKNLREGNIFSRVCLADHRGCHVTITHDALDLTTQGPPLCTETQSRPHPLYRDPLACPLQTWACSNLFRLDLALQVPSPHPLDMFKLFVMSLWSTYGRQAGGWHPTRMLSCLKCNQSCVIAPWNSAMTTERFSFVLK